MHFTTNVIYCIIITVLKVVFYKYRHQTSAVYPPQYRIFSSQFHVLQTINKELLVLILKKKWFNLSFSPTNYNILKTKYFSHYIICSLLSGQFWVIWFIKYCYARFLYIFWQTYVLFWSINKNIEKPS